MNNSKFKAPLISLPLTNMFKCPRKFVKEIDQIETDAEKNKLKNTYTVSMLIQ